jgi:anthranilate/para-aminobenzoate synthase component I
VHIRRLSVPPDVLRLARRVWSARHPALLWTADGSGPSYLAVDPIAVVQALDPEPTLTLSPRSWNFGAVPRWIGVLPYEAERARLERSAGELVDTRPAAMLASPVWLRYPAVAVIDREVTVVGDDLVAVDQLAQRLKGPDIPPGVVRLRGRPEPGFERHHEARIREALHLIRAGEIYQVNVAHRLEFDCHGSSLEVLARLVRRAQSPYAGAIDLPNGTSFVSTSPELFLETHAGGRAMTLPIKGTRPRGANAAESMAARAELDADPKERAELAMVVDIERNDLNRVSEVGSVVAELPRVVARSKVFHRQALVAGRLRAAISRQELLCAMLPSGSVTGAPKVRAMQIIATLESRRRGAYTGAWGLVAHDGSLRLGMNIRCLTQQAATAEYWVGGGVVADSDPEREVQETHWKAVQVVSACTDD